MHTTQQKIDPIDTQLFLKGVHYKLYDVLGAHLGAGGTRFALWAPNAKKVYVAGDFNEWAVELEMERRDGGVWERFVEGAQEGDHYKYVIDTGEGLLWKADPMAFYAQERPETASIVSQVDGYEWSPWEFKSGPVKVYEVHLGSWKKGLGYREAAHELAEYCNAMGFTHAELLPIMEHPLDESWGYQVSGFFAPTARYGSIRDFQYFVDYMHRQGLGVILDWVPSHFPMDGFGLAQFDGKALYEYHDTKMGYHPQWDTLIFDYASARVQNFLLASALFWLDKYNIDGLRIDAMESIIMRDYSKKEGEWIPNIHGGRENLEAIDFLKHLNSIIQERFPGRITAAEDSSMFEGVTHPLESGGLGFTYKWALGWMHDTLNVFTAKEKNLDGLTHIFNYITKERYLLPLSHDEVVHGKKSLLEKMPGDDFEKRALLRMLFAWMYICPGDELLFMGCEFAQEGEWNCKESLRWDDADASMQAFIKDLNGMKIEGDVSYELGDYLTVRRGSITALFNFSENSYDAVGLSSDRVEYGGKGREGLAPQTVIIYE